MVPGHYTPEEVAAHHGHSPACLHCRAVVNELLAHDRLAEAAPSTVRTEHGDGPDEHPDYA